MIDLAILIVLIAIALEIALLIYAVVSGDGLGYPETFDADDYEEVEGPEEDDGGQPLAVDPLRMPRPATYQPQGDGVRLCNCHNQALVPGESVILWPVPGSEGASMWIFHPDMVNPLEPTE